jgi:adenosylcobinamide-phosphate synthase
MDFVATLLALGLALVLEAVLGYPAALQARIGHPVSWMGALIGALDRRFNDADQSADERRRAGLLGLFVLLIVTGFVAETVTLLVLSLPLGLVLVAGLASSLLAARSLDEHVGAVAEALEAGLPSGRAAVSHIVGRNPEALDEAGIARAAIESLAENFSDGVVAPAFWFACLGLPGAALYKAINTADSMIGHRTPRHEAYGAAAARLDDLVNLPASRLAMLLIVVAAAILPGASPSGAWRTARRDARRHRSPNAGWPEAAMAGALGFRLNGPKTYGERRVGDAFMGDGRAELDAADILRALRLYRLACLVLLGLVASLAGLLVYGFSG